LEERYKNKHHISSSRLTGWDYGSHGLYFVTICTKDRIRYFGEIVETCIEDQYSSFLQNTDIGLIAQSYWLQIPEYYSFIKLDDFIIMPDHIHAILFIDKPGKTTWEGNKFGVQRDNLAAVLRGYKASVKKYANENGIEFSWQSRYYDRVIRDQREYENIRQYIHKNPDNWLANKDGFENLYF
jgi:REP element-mobilizing transposase RayT